MNENFYLRFTLGEDSQLTREDDNIVVSNSRNLYHCRFNLSVQQGAVFTATFSRGRAVYAVELDENNECIIPNEVLRGSDDTRITVGLFATISDVVSASTICEIPVLKGTPTYGATADFTPTLYQQMLKRISEVCEGIVDVDVVNELVENYLAANLPTILTETDVENIVTAYVTENRATFKGDKGDRGEKGEQGIQGIQGERGEQGEKGDKGDTGAQGIQGIQGDKGDKGDNGKSAYQIAIDNGFVGTEEQWLASLKGEKGDSGEGSGTSYDDTEIKSEIADIWKANGELGAKNLIAYPYAENDITRSSVTWHVNDDGSIDVKGKIDSNPNKYSYISIFNSILNLDANTYTLSLYSKTIISNSHIAFRILNWDNRNYLELAKANTNKSVNFTISQEMIDAINNGDSQFQMIAQVNDLNEEYDLTVYPMLRLASDPDDTWQPPAKTNKELSDAVNELQTGLQNATNNINIRVTHLNVRSGSCNSLKNRYYRYFVEGSTTSDAPNNIDNFLLVAFGLTANTITGQAAINANTGDIYYRHTSDNGTTWEEWQKYGDVELNDAIADVYKVMGETGSKNLIPIYEQTKTASGVTYTVCDNGSITVGGDNQTINYTYIDITSKTRPFIIGSGDYIISADGLDLEKCLSVEVKYQIADYSQNATNLAAIGVKNGKYSTQFSITEEQAEQIESGNYLLIVRICIYIPNADTLPYEFTNTIVHPMIRRAEDTDPTWQPYVPTNKELNEKIEEVYETGAERQVIVNDTNISDYVLQPNTLYCFKKDGAFASTVNIQLENYSDNVAREYHFIFSSGAGCEMVLPSSISFMGDFEIKPNKVYEVSILTSLLVYHEWDKGVNEVS